MTLEERIAAVNAAGFLVNNLFQIGGKWRCNLIAADQQTYADFGEGADPASALDVAFEKMKREPIDALGPFVVKKAPAAPAAPVAEDAEDLLS